MCLLVGCAPPRPATGPALGEGEDAEPVTARAGQVGPGTVLHKSGYRERAEYAAGLAVVPGSSPGRVSNPGSRAIGAVWVWA